MALTEHKRLFIIDCAYEEDTAVLLLVSTDSRWTPGWYKYLRKRRSLNHCAYEEELRQFYW